MRPVQTALQAGLFQETSLLYKDVAAHADRRAGCANDVREGQRRAFQHRTSIERVVAALGQSVRCGMRHGGTSSDFWPEEIKPPEAAPPPYDYSTLYMVGRALPSRQAQVAVRPGG